MKYPKYKIGDSVKILSESREGVITDIQGGWREDRWGRKFNRKWYRIPSPKAGMPVEWYIATDLVKIKEVKDASNI